MNDHMAEILQSQATAMPLPSYSMATVAPAQAVNGSGLEDRVMAESIMVSSTQSSAAVFLRPRPGDARGPAQDQSFPAPTPSAPAEPPQQASRFNGLASFIEGLDSIPFEDERFTASEAPIAPWCTPDPDELVLLSPVKDSLEDGRVAVWIRRTASTAEPRDGWALEEALQKPVSDVQGSRSRDVEADAHFSLQSPMLPETHDMQSALTNFSPRIATESPLCLECVS